MLLLASTKKKRSSGKNKSMVSCLCDCGSVYDYEQCNIVSGNTKRCKECSRSFKVKARTTHGHSISNKDADPDGYNCYTRWQAMKRRCYLETDRRYSDYGGRGVKVCGRWLESYENFLEDMGLPPERSYQIDRIDNDGDYCPGNCRWVTNVQNARNKRSNKLITAFGETLTQAEWAERTGIKRETIAMRLKRGWAPELALVGKKM